MAKKNKNHKLLFIKNNGLDMKEISLSTIYTSISLFSVFLLSFTIISIYSTDIIELIDKSFKDIDTEKEYVEQRIINKHKENNEKLESKIVEQAGTIESLILELDAIKERDETLRQLLKLPSIDDDIRKLSVGGSENKDESNNLNYLLPNEIDIYYLNEQLSFIRRTINLENISYSEMEKKLNPNKLYQNFHMNL